MTFKKRRGIKLPYAMQGLIHFTCLTYKVQPEAVQCRIRLLCAAVSKGEPSYGQALFEMLTTEHSVESIALKHSVSERTLYRLRKRFYEDW